MKLIKTKLSLLALALACFFAGVMGLHPTATAKADIDTTGFTMTNGAYIRLVDDYSGISWTTTVSPEFYNRIEASVSSRFGVIVAPTNSFVGELTHETTLTSGSVKDIPVSSAVDASENAVTYRSVINYNDLFTNYRGPLSEEELLERAYAMELTARAYVTVDSGTTYIYASLDGINTSRSARQVAVAAELAGVIDDEYRNDADPDVQALALNAEDYYGGSITVLAESNGAVGTPYIDKENPTATVNVSVAITGDFEEAVIGAESITATYSAGTLTITEANYIPTGENYITIFTSTGVFATPVIGATKVFDEIEDFEAFQYFRNNHADAENAKIDYVIQDSIDDPSRLVHDGYYVLANNITVSNEYTRPIVGPQKGSWKSNTSFAGQPLGLTGTFNGLGHYIDNLTINNTDSGLFELINGGTVKNFALTNLKAVAGTTAATGLAYVVIDPVIENVYIHINGTYSMVQQYAMCANIVQTQAGKANLSNIFMDCKFTVDGTAGANGGAIASLSGSYTTSEGTGRGDRDENILDVTNMFLVSNIGYYYRQNKSNRFYGIGYAENERATYIAIENATDMPAELIPEGIPAVALESISTEYYVRGGYHYKTVADLKAANHDFTSLVNSGCWTIVSGVPVWSSTLS